MSRTRLRVERDRHGRRVRLEVGSDGPGGRGHLGIRVLDTGSDHARVALVAEGALVVAGDDVGVDLAVGEAVHLEVVEPAGTVAYDMRGGCACWSVAMDVADRGRLVWRSQPLVVSTGARLDRTLQVALHGSAVAVLRETIVLGRTRECGGVLLQHTRVLVDEEPVLAEDLDLDGARPRVGVLAGRRVLDTVSVLGCRASGIPTPGGARRLDLEAEGTLVRSMGQAAHLSPLDGAWASALEVTAGARAPVR